MIAELGHILLTLALGAALVQVIVPLARLRQTGPLAIFRAFDERDVWRLSRRCSWAQLACTSLAMLALMVVYIIHDFSVLNVWQNSHSTQPLIYRIASSWGNHEGSLLLWVAILCLFAVGFGELALRRGECVAHTFGVLAVQGAVNIGFLLFLLLTSNPFARIFPPGQDGQDLNPLLQDYALTLHPPLLYAGYVGFSIVFSGAINALIRGEAGPQWAQSMRVWAQCSWMFLTAGIAAGSYWAYYELGWGGWWFWDPVENASLLPWLSGTALLHSLLVLERRDTLRVWTLLLALMTFSFSLIGMFLVRSGVLTSVHAFANDPERGLFILLLIGIVVGGGLGLFAWKAPRLRAGSGVSPLSREGWIVINNLFLSTACATVFLGTIYPLILEVITGAAVSVGAPYYVFTFLPLALPAVAAIPIGTSATWRQADLGNTLARLRFAALLAPVIAGAILVAGDQISLIALLGLPLGFWVILGTLAPVATRIQLFRVPLHQTWARFRGIRFQSHGATLAHLGIGLFILGVVGEGGYQQEKITSVRASESFQLGEYEFELTRFRDTEGPNWIERSAEFNLKRDGEVVRELKPSQRIYPVRDGRTTESAIAYVGPTHIYLSIGEIDPSGEVNVRAYIKPFISLIWIGALFCLFGGALTIGSQAWSRQVSMGKQRSDSTSKVVEGTHVRS